MPKDVPYLYPSWISNEANNTCENWHSGSDKEPILKQFVYSYTAEEYAAMQEKQEMLRKEAEEAKSASDANDT